MEAERLQLRVITPEATADEVAAIVAALTVVLAPVRGGTTSSRVEASPWVAASRLAARRTGLSRGDWRMSGRIGRRARA